MSCNFIFCLHNHQPIGNFDHIFEWAFNDCYNKTIEILKEYPEFRFAIHHTGPLLEWIKNYSPDYLHTLKIMQDTGQIEIIGGGFYEPIFSIINEEDVKGQLALMQNFCQDEFNAAPKGFWTAERVWDPEIPRLVNGFGLDYTILDDIHFRYAGIDENELRGYFLTERLDHKLKVFPIDKYLRYSIPFKLPEETIDYFKKKTDETGNSAFVYGDDGEKFGLWPETFQWVFEERWLRNFIEKILKEDWIEMTLPSEYLLTNSPRGRVYLTQGSYFELSEWALPAKAARKLININNEIKGWKRENDFYPYLKGGIWNNFLNKYPESNAMNKRTILLSKEINEYEIVTGNNSLEIKTALYKGECNCAYWHGLFGGIYLNNLRHSLYENILKAEHLLLQKQKSKDITILEKDFWNEGHKQILVRKEDQSTIYTPYLGGTISELGIYKKHFNIFNVIHRRIEAYHETLKNLDDEAESSNKSHDEVASIHDRIIVKEKNLKKYLVYDSSRRYSFKDLFLKIIPEPEDFIFGTAEVFDCGQLEYECKNHKKNGELITSMSKSVNFNNERISINKKFSINKTITGIKAVYNITGLINCYFGVELNINLLGGHDEDRFYDIPNIEKDASYLDIPGRNDSVKSFSMVDKFNNFKININTSLESTLLRYPIYTVSQSDSGFEKNYQGSSIILIFNSNELSEELTIEVIIE